MNEESQSHSKASTPTKGKFQSVMGGGRKRKMDLNDLLEDRELRAFFRYVDNHKLRQKAAEIIDRHLSTQETVH